MPSIRVKITDPLQPAPWFASAWDAINDPTKTVRRLNTVAQHLHGKNAATYELATEAQYQAYRAETRAIIAKGG